jgi:hypothetical protein
MTKKKNTDLIPVSPELQANIDIILSVKSEVDQLGKNCLQIKIIDEQTLIIAQQNLSSVNSIINSIEEKRKKIKQPYLDAGRLIDSTCEEIVSLAQDGINHIKTEIKNWEAKRKEDALKAQEELERKLADEKAAAEADEARKAEIRDFLNSKAIPLLKKLYSDAATPQMCDTAIDYIKKNFPQEGRFQEYTEEAFAQRDNYISLIETKKQQLISADNLSDAEKELIKQKEELAKEKLKIAEAEAAIKEKEEKIKAEAEKKAKEEAAEKERLRLAAEAEANKTKNVRYIWKFELLDKSKLSQEWIAIDEASVKSWLKENKDNIKDGEIINGVKFFQDQSVRA